MQEGIIQIGKILMEDGGGILDNLITEVKPVRKEANGKERQLYVFKYDFITTEQKLVLDVDEQMGENSARKYFYIGAAPGANSKQWYSSSTNSYYHLSETIPNLCEVDFGNELNEKLKFIRDTYFIDLGDSFKSNKNRYALNLQRLPGGTFDLAEYYQTIIGESEKDKKDLLKKAISREFAAYLDDAYQMKLQKDFGLFTILIDGEPLCNKEEYRAAVLREKEGADKEKKAGTIKGHCYFCGAKDQLRDDVIVEIKSYTTNLYGFASGTDKKNYRKNMLLCQDCLNAYLAGEKYVKNNLNLNLARFRVYLYPHFIYGNPFNKTSLDRMCDQLKYKFHTISNVETVKELRDFIDEELAIQGEEEQTAYSVNLVFYRQAQKATKIQRFIKDVAPSRFDLIASCLDETQETFRRHFPNSGEGTILNLRMLYYLFPIRLDNKNEATVFRSLLELYDSILSGKPVQKLYIIRNLNHCARIIHFEEKGFNISNNELGMTIMRGNALIEFLRHLNLFEGGEDMNVEELHCSQELKDFIVDMHYGPEAAALFLLGTLIGEIGRAQYNRTKKKPILNKINFGGMDKQKLLRLSGKVFEKLKQEGSLDNNTELIYSDFNQLCIPHLDDWGLTKEENLFYILSGYSYVTRKAITSKKKDGGKSNEQQ